MKLKNVLFGVGLIAIVVLVSCQLKIEPDATMSPTTVLTEKVQVTTVGLETPMSTPIMIQPTITVAQIVSPSHTPLPEESKTPTPLPTLSYDEAIDRVLSLLNDNHNPDCLLPCWWGATPGQTQWHDIEPFLKSFAIQIKESPKGVSVKIPLPTSVAEHGYSYISYGWDESRIIRGISIYSVNIAGYDPKTMMTIYGVPDEVWLKTYSGILPGGVLPFQLIITYQDKGVSFHYYTGAATDGETVTVCFEPGAIETERPDLFPVGPQIRLWESGQHKTVDEIASIPDETYYPLEEKTDLTPQTFYEKFTNPNESPCIDTPAALWN